MSEDRILDLLPNTRTMYESQEKWRTKASEDTLSSHKDEIENLLEKANLFDIWSNSLQGSEAARRLIPEIFMDGYMSIHFACYGLYKYANTCLRSQLETALRLIYFSTHPVEFDWWCKENKWYRSGLKNRDVWGEGYEYFKQLEYVKKFEGTCRTDQRLFTEGSKVNRIYDRLSAYVHSGVFSLQTRPDEFSPRYKIQEYKKWTGNFKEIQSYINVLLALGFPEEFKRIGEGSRDRVLQVGIESLHHREKLKEVIGS